MDKEEICNRNDGDLERHIVVRAKAQDCYAGLKGRDYITARRLGKLVQAQTQESAQELRE